VKAASSSRRSFDPHHELCHIARRSEAERRRVRESRVLAALM